MVSGGRGVSGVVSPGGHPSLPPSANWGGVNKNPGCVDCGDSGGVLAVFPAPCVYHSCIKTDPLSEEKHVSFLLLSSIMKGRPNTEPTERQKGGRVLKNL